MISNQKRKLGACLSGFLGLACTAGLVMKQALAQGKLILDNLDFATRWSDDGPATVFHLPESDFYARNCTFSIAGKSPQGIALVRRQPRPIETPVSDLQAAWRERTPLVSVIVLARNEEANIGACLEGILSQDYPPDRIEVIVLDGMSGDRTREVVAGFAHRGVPVRVVPNPARQRTHGLNLGIQAARGEVICRIDARTRIPSTYVSSCLRAMRETGAEYPQIWHMFAFRPEATKHLERFTQAIMREPARIRPGLRELIAAFTSARNACPF